MIWKHSTETQDLNTLARTSGGVPHCLLKGLLWLLFSHQVLSDSFETSWPVVSQVPLCPWDLSGKNTRMGSHFLLQVLFLTQGLNPCLLLWQADSLPPKPRGKPRRASRSTKKAVVHMKVKIAQSCPSLCDRMDYAI